MLTSCAVNNYTTSLSSVMYACCLFLLEPSVRLDEVMDGKPPLFHHLPLLYRAFTQHQIVLLSDAHTPFS